MVTSLILFFITEKNIDINFEVTNYIYYISGFFGIGIVIFIMRAVLLLGPSSTILISLITQLTIALIIDSFGLFDLKKVPFQINKLFGIIILILGVGIFTGVVPYKKKERTYVDSKVSEILPNPDGDV